MSYTFMQDSGLFVAMLEQGTTTSLLNGENMQKLRNNKVFEDYRNNIIIDKDNPILAFKANRDRFTRNKNQNCYEGLPQVGSKNSEDAITWNYFRSLQENQNYNSLSKLIGLPLQNPEILLWTLDINHSVPDFQYTCGNILRTIDGIHKGQITEPDVIIKTSNYLIIVECKLGIKEQYPTHLWACDKNSKGPELRRRIYFSTDLFTGDKDYNGEAYQLYRMAFFSAKIADEYNLKPVLISLTNKTWWNKKKGTRCPNDIWSDFITQINQDKLILKNVFWQDIEESGILQELFINHDCL